MHDKSLKKKKKRILFLKNFFGCLCACHICAGAHRGQNRVLDPRRWRSKLLSVGASREFGYLAKSGLHSKPPGRQVSSSLHLYFTPPSSSLSFAFIKASFTMHCQISRAVVSCSVFFSLYSCL